MTCLPWRPCACGQPWDAHELRCPRQKHHGVGRVVALAVAGGIALQIPFLVVAALVVADLTPPSVSFAFIHRPPAGPIQPRVQGCELFYAWGRTHNPSLLNRAVGDAYSSRVPWQFARRFRTDLSGLRNWTRKSAHSPTAISFEHAVQDNCKVIKADLNWRHRPAFRRAIAQFSRPSTANGGRRAPASSGLGLLRS